MARIIEGAIVNKPKHALTPNVQSTTHAAPAAPRAGVNSTLVAIESYTQFITHKLWGKLTGALGMNHPDQVASCPVLMRVINAANPDHPWAVDVSVNGLKVLSNVPFGSASRYVSVSPGNLRVRITKAGTRKLIDSRTFAGAPNNAYSVALTGSLQGPPGKLLFNKSPFVILEDVSPPSPGKFKGRSYILSQTKSVIDLRIIKSDAPDVDRARLVDISSKTWVNYPEMDAGTYNFNPSVQNNSDHLVNSADNPHIGGEIAKVKIPAGTIFDVFAIGNPHNSLKLSAASYKTLPPTASACKIVQ